MRSPPDGRNVSGVSRHRCWPESEAVKTGAILRECVYERSSPRQAKTSGADHPAILIALRRGSIGIIVLRVVPAFTDFYERIDAELPISRASSCGLDIRSTISLMWRRSPWRRSSPLDSPPVASVRDSISGFEGSYSARNGGQFKTAPMARTRARRCGGGMPLVNAMEVRPVGRERYMSKEIDDAHACREGGARGSLTRAPWCGTGLEDDRVGESTAAADMLGAWRLFFDEEAKHQWALRLHEPAFS